MTTPDPTTSQGSANSIWKGIFYSNILAVAAFTIAYAVSYWNEDAGAILSFSEFVLVPMVMGIVAIKFWMNTGRSVWSLIPYVLLNTLIGISLSALFMGEGYICIIIVSPLVFGFMLIGVIIGRYMLPRNNTTLKASTLLIFLTLFLYDTLSEHNYVNEVSDEILVLASPAIVWNYVAQHPVNNSNPDYWLFTVGLPQPMQSTITADSIGAERKCIFSNGATFDEVVIENIKDSVFTFDIIKQPEDPEIIGHIKIERGQFILSENPDGTTTLTGKSWYRLMVFPAWYYDLWAEDITREVHLRVMNHIKQLAEKDV